MIFHLLRLGSATLCVCVALWLLEQPVRRSFKQRQAEAIIAGNISKSVGAWRKGRESTDFIINPRELTLPLSSLTTKVVPRDENAPETAAPGTINEVVAVRIPTKCERSNRKHRGRPVGRVGVASPRLCTRDGRGKALRSRLTGVILDLVGPRGILFFVGDSTMRYQFFTLCKCISAVICASVLDGRRMRSCGANSMSKTASDEPLIVFDEIAGGSSHLPWSDPTNRATASIARLSKLVDRDTHGGLVVYANLGALHLLWNKLIGWPDFSGFLTVEQRVEQEASEYRAAGAKTTIFMLPHWICIPKLPLALQKYINPNRTDNRAGDRMGGDAGKKGAVLATNMVDDNDNLCVKFLESSMAATAINTSSRALPKAARKISTTSRAERLSVCRGAYLNPVGAAGLAKRINTSVVAATNTNGQHLAIVDGYALTARAGCSSTPDGRHWPEATVLLEVDALVDELERLAHGGKGRGSKK